MTTGGRRAEAAAVAAISDIHGNAPALAAVLAEIDGLGVETIIACGDHAAGPLPAEAIDLLLGLGPRLVAIQGNADRELNDWWAGRLRPGQAEWLRSLPGTAMAAVAGLGEVLFCHASPRNDTEIFTAATADDRIRPMFAGVRQPTVVCGHTHMQVDRHLGRIRILNCGSVGMNYGRSGAHWLLLGPGVEFRRTLYDLDAAAVWVRASGFPEAEEFAARHILDPYTAEEAIAIFEPRAGAGPATGS